jgi:hypothetical protein
VPLVLLGDQVVEGQTDYNPAGMAEAFQYTASAGGRVDKLWLYLDPSNTATSLVLGLYADSGANSPGALLTQGTLLSPVNGAWNGLAVPPASVAAGGKYWLAALGPSGGGLLRFRDVASGGRAQTSAQTTLGTLPATWTTGASYTNSPMSAYAVQLP